MCIVLVYIRGNHAVARKYTTVEKEKE